MDERRRAEMLSALVLAMFWSEPGRPATAERTVVRPADTGAALVNPMMGWTFHHYSYRPAVNTPAGAFDLFVSVGDRTGTPIIALPLAGDDGTRRYKVGEIVIAEAN